MIPDVKFLSQTYQYIPELGVSGYVLIELVSSYQNLDGEPTKDFLYERYTWSTSVSGDFDFLREIPLGLAAVSGA